MRQFDQFLETTGYTGRKFFIASADFFQFRAFCDNSHAIADFPLDAFFYLIPHCVIRNAGSVNKAITGFPGCFFFGIFHLFEVPVYNQISGILCGGTEGTENERCQQCGGHFFHFQDPFFYGLFFLFGFDISIRRIGEMTRI